MTAEATKDEGPTNMNDRVDPLVTRLTEIATRANAATPGPWRAVESGTRVRDPDLTRPGVPRYITTESDRILDPNDMEVIDLPDGMYIDKQVRADLEFMANARSDIDFLLAEIKRLRDQVHTEDR